MRRRRTEKRFGILVFYDRFLTNWKQLQTSEIQAKREKVYIRCQGTADAVESILSDLVRVDSRLEADLDGSDQNLSTNFII
jgi:hypothetical protein